MTYYDRRTAYKDGGICKVLRRMVNSVSFIMGMDNNHGINALYVYQYQTGEVKLIHEQDTVAMQIVTPLMKEVCLSFLYLFCILLKCLIFFVIS